MILTFLSFLLLTLLVFAFYRNRNCSICRKIISKNTRLIVTIDCSQNNTLSSSPHLVLNSVIELLEAKCELASLEIEPFLLQKIHFTNSPFCSDPTFVSLLSAKHFSKMDVKIYEGGRIHNKMAINKSHFISYLILGLSLDF